MAGDGGVFVGRERELATLAATLEQTIAGHGRVLMLAGEPGIGKTRTAQVLGHLAEQHDVQVLWGRCHEEPGAPPYWPWLQAIRAWLDGQADDRLPDAMGHSASYLAEIVPEIAQRLPELPPVPRAADAAQARFLLFDAITSFLKRAAADRTLLLILDNLHRADTSSLRLLEFLAPEVGASRLLVLGTYRDIELTRQHPLSDTLGELARHQWFQRLHLTGLSLPETGRFMAAATGRAPPDELLATVHNQTEGNPLFLVEMTRYLTQEGVLAAAQPTAHSGSGHRPRRIPEGVREAIGTRVNRLSPLTNRVLASAAVIGRSFSLDVLTRLLDDVTGEQCAEALEEALIAHVIEALPQPNRYQFSHALIRETLYDELLATRRARLHSRTGEALETLRAGDLEAHLSQLAYHFHEAAILGDAAKAIAYAERAGARAEALLAFEEAVRFYGLALELQQQHFPHDNGHRCQLLLALGWAQNAAGASEPCLDTFLEAGALARELTLGGALAGAALGFESGGWKISRHGDQAVALLAEALALPTFRDERLQVNLLAALCRAYIFCDRPTEANAAYRKAVALARRLGHASTLFRALAALVPATWPEQLDERLAAAREALVLAERSGHPEWAVGEVTGWYFPQLVEQGDMDSARAVLAIHVRVAEAMRQPFLQAVGHAGRTLMAMHEGRFAEAEVMARETLVLARRVSPENAAGAYGMQMFSLYREQGRLNEVLPMFRQFIQTAPKAGTWRPGLALLYAELGMRDEARAEFENLATAEFVAILRDGLWLTCITFMAEVCVYLNDKARATTLYRLMAPCARRNIVTGNVACFGAADRFLGMLATTLEQWEKAERHFEAALAMDSGSGGRPWLAHSQYQYAAMLLSHKKPGDRERIVALLNEALATSRALGMRALEEHVHTLQQRTQSQPGRAAYPAGLSRREVEVLRLVAAGKANRDIAKRLFISENTVANHVRSILTKTDTANRTEAAAFATQHGLLNDSPER